MNNLHLSWDIESQDTLPTAIVVSIGACLFDPKSDFVSDKLFEVVLDRDVQLVRGRTVSDATMTWWAEQTPEARAVFDRPTMHPRQALLDLADYMNEQPLDGVWGNGSDFDNVIIGDLYRSFGIQPPWKFWTNRCVRTLKALKLPKAFVKPAREGVHHNALDDALHQARYVQAVSKALNLEF